MILFPAIDILEGRAVRLYKGDRNAVTDYGDPLEIAPDEVPVFWACGVTPQAVAMQAKPDLMISHSPGYMLICDIKSSEL